MKKLLLIAAVLLAGAAPAHAQKTKAQISAEITSLFADNTTGAITAGSLRTVTNDLAISIMPTAPVVANNTACFDGTTGLLKDCGVAPSTLIVGTTVINSGTVKGILYNNAGVLGNLAATGGAVPNSASDGTPSMTPTPVLGVAGASVGSVGFQNLTSGTITLQPALGALGSSVLSLPAATDTLVGVATSDNLLNKTYNKVTITPPASSATLTIPDGVTLTGPAASGTAMTLGNNETVTGVKTFGSAGAVGKLAVAGNTSGSTTLNASATASGTLTLPAATDTLVGKATTDILTNKTFDSAGTGNVMQISGVTVSRGQIPGVNSNTAATAGNIGEIISSTVASGSAVALTTATPANVTSISLTAGEWDVSAMIGFTGNTTTTVTVQIGSISTTSATLDTTDGRIQANAYNAQAVYNLVNTRNAVGPARISLSGTTTVYLVAQSTFATSTSGAFGILRATRIH